MNKSNRLKKNKIKKTNVKEKGKKGKILDTNRRGSLFLTISVGAKKLRNKKTHEARKRNRQQRIWI